MNFSVSFLRDYGWPQREVERAFFEVYEELTGRPIPTPKGGSGESARDAFFYLLMIITLAIWTQALESWRLSLSTTWCPIPWTVDLADPSWQVAFCLARLIVSYPVYLWVMRQLNQETGGPSGEVLFWGAQVADLPHPVDCGVDRYRHFNCVPHVFSEGRFEPTRFILKVLVILLIDGGVLWYYFHWIRREPEGKNPAG